MNSEPASYMIVDRETGKAVREIFTNTRQWKWVKQYGLHPNFKAVPALEYLKSLNKTD